MVTTEQIEKIKEQFIEVIRYSQNIENPLVDELFEIWYEKKKKIETSKKNGKLTDPFTVLVMGVDSEKENIKSQILPSAKG